MNILKKIENIEDYLVSIRRELHMYPEVSFEEHNTASIIERELNAIGVKNKRVANTGVLGLIESNNPGKTVALRADIDALAISEENDFSFKSKNEGVMHACGHDLHTAGLLGAAKVLNQMKNEINGNILLIFQPAEEMVQGAQKMIEEDNFMEDVDAVIGIHNSPDHEVGEIAVRDGGTMFAGEMFKITVEGQTGHGALPNNSIDALLVASNIVINTQAILGREIDPREPAVITITTMEAGVRHNIMPDKAIMTGTYRCYSPRIEKQIKEALERIIKETANTFRANAYIEYDMHVPAVINDSTIGSIVRNSATKIVGKKNVLEAELSAGSDDFSYFQLESPGYYILVGSANIDKSKRQVIHGPLFNPDEKSLNIIASMYGQFAIDFLTTGG